MLQIDILRNFSKFFWVSMGGFRGFGYPKRHPDALLAKTMLLGFIISSVTFSTYLPDSSGSARPIKLAIKSVSQDTCRWCSWGQHRKPS